MVRKKIYESLLKDLHPDVLEMIGSPDMNKTILVPKEFKAPYWADEVNQENVRQKRWFRRLVFPRNTNEYDLYVWIAYTYQIIEMKQSQLYALLSACEMKNTEMKKMKEDCFYSSRNNGELFTRIPFDFIQYNQNNKLKKCIATSITLDDFQSSTNEQKRVLFQTFLNEKAPSDFLRTGLKFVQTQYNNERQIWILIKAFLYKIQQKETFQSSICILLDEMNEQKEDCAVIISTEKRSERQKNHSCIITAWHQNEETQIVSEDIQQIIQTLLFVMNRITKKDSPSRHKQPFLPSFKVVLLNDRMFTSDSSKFFSLNIAILYELSMRFNIQNKGIDSCFICERPFVQNGDISMCVICQNNEMRTWVNPCEKTRENDNAQRYQPRQSNSPTF